MITEEEEMIVEEEEMMEEETPEIETLRSTEEKEDVSFAKRRVTRELTARSLEVDIHQEEAIDPEAEA